MPQLLYTVSNLVAEVRSLLDEENVDAIDTEADILPALNRGQAFAFDILARKYPEPILSISTLDLLSGVADYDMPETIFEDRVLKLEVSTPGGTQREVQRISFRDISGFETSTQTSVPYYYCIIGRTIRVVPTPTGTYDVRLWSLRNAEKLVLPQGRITVVNTSANYVIVDETGSGLTTESDQLGSYVNVVDGQTGVIKKTLQIQSIDDSKITFRSVPQRSEVLNRAISGSYSSSDVGQDDYLCAIDGICVPYFGQPTSNFLIQFAVAELTRRLGGEASTEEQILDKFEKQVERTWVGREKKMRIQKRSQSWGVPTRRYSWE